MPYFDSDWSDVSRVMDVANTAPRCIPDVALSVCGGELEVAEIRWPIATPKYRQLSDSTRDYSLSKIALRTPRASYPTPNRPKENAQRQKYTAATTRSANIRRGFRAPRHSVW